MPSNEALSERTQRPTTISEAVPTPPAAQVRRNPADEILGALVRHWLIAALVAAAVVVLATLVASVQPKRYRAESISAVGLVPAAMSTSETLHGVETLDRRLVIASIAALAETPAIRQQSGAAGDDAISASVLPSTSLFRIAVEGRDPRHVANVANTIPRALAAQARSMYLIYDVSTLSPAVPPQKASSPRLERAAAAGLLFGILCGVAAAYLVDRRFRASLPG